MTTPRSARHPRWRPRPRRFSPALSPSSASRRPSPSTPTSWTRWHFIPTYDVPAQRAADQGDDRAAARARARPAQGRSQPAGLPDGLRDHGSRKRAQGARSDRARCATRELYFFSVFGTPRRRATWGWRVEGHHISLHFTVGNGTAVASSPAFFGSNPAEVREGAEDRHARARPAGGHARALLDTLDPAQRTAATSRPTRRPTS